MLKEKRINGLERLRLVVLRMMLGYASGASKHLFKILVSMMGEVALPSP
jgi:hypothetical protein